MSDLATEHDLYKKQAALAQSFDTLKRLCGDDDPELLHDMIEGETDFDAFADSLIDQIGEDEAKARAIKARAAEMTTRAKRYSDRSDRLRVLLTRLMEQSEIKKISSDFGTVSLRTTAPELVIKEESYIPAKYWEQADPKLNKKLLKEDLANNKVDGAELGNGGITISIRRA